MERKMGLKGGIANGFCGRLEWADIDLSDLFVWFD